MVIDKIVYAKSSITMGNGIQWQNLESEDELQAIEQFSSDRPVLVFKHSKRCGLSHSVKQRLEEEWTASHPDVGELIPRSVATLGVNYSVYPYLLLRFVTSADDTDQITPANLGDTIHLGVFPGPEGGDFLPEADVTAEDVYAEIKR